MMWAVAAVLDSITVNQWAQSSTKHSFFFPFRQMLCSFPFFYLSFIPLKINSEARTWCSGDWFDSRKLMGASGKEKGSRETRKGVTTSRWVDDSWSHLEPNPAGDHLGHWVEPASICSHWRWREQDTFCSPHPLSVSCGLLQWYSLPSTSGLYLLGAKHTPGVLEQAFEQRRKMQALGWNPESRVLENVCHNS